MAADFAAACCLEPFSFEVIHALQLALPIVGICLVCDAELSCGSIRTDVLQHCQPTRACIVSKAIGGL
jgi:hypothetical protein